MNSHKPDSRPPAPGSPVRKFASFGRIEDCLAMGCRGLLCLSSTSVRGHFASEVAIKAGVEFMVPTFCLLAVAVEAETVGVPMSQRKIVQLVKGNTAEGNKTRDQINYEFVCKSIPSANYFAADGRLVERDRGGGSSQAIDAKGTWWVKKGKLCLRYPNSLRDTDKKCRLIVPRGEGAYELRSVKGKTTHTRDRILPGNPRGLIP